MRVETERLRLRPLRASDLDDLAALYADPQAMRFSLGLLDRERSRERLEHHVEMARKRDLGAHAVVDRADDRFLGICGFHPQTIDGVEEIEVGYRLMPHAWGRGVATEALCATVAYGLETLKLPRIIAIVEPENAASCRVAEKAGLVLERSAHKWERFVRIYAAGPASAR